jgi:hypothetical protein
MNETGAPPLADQEADGKRFRCFGQAWIIEVWGWPRREVRDHRRGTPRPSSTAPVPSTPPPAVTLHVRTAGDPAARVGTVRAPEVQSHDARMPIHQRADHPREALDQVLWGPRMSASLLGAFAALAPPAGRHRASRCGCRIPVAERDPGVRHPDGDGSAPGGHAEDGDAADDAHRRHRGRHRPSSSPTAATRGLGNLLIGVPAGDPVTFGATLAVILGAALAASWPAWRASRIDRWSLSDTDKGSRSSLDAPADRRPGPGTSTAASGGASLLPATLELEPSPWDIDRPESPRPEPVKRPRWVV